MSSLRDMGMEPVSAEAPPSKSVSHRVLIGAALAGGESVVEGALESKDPERTRAVLSVAGAVFEPLGPGAYRVRGVGGRLTGAGPDAEPVSCDVHESGTSCRLLTALLASGYGRFRIHGAPRMHRRPLGGLTGPLTELGARFHFEEREGYPPCVLEASGLDGGVVGMGLDESSQYLSGLLMAAPQARGPLTIEITGRQVVSWPYIGLTLQTMRDFGIHFDVSERDPEAGPDAPWRVVDWRSVREARPGGVRFRVRPSAWRAGRYTVEGDWSGASYLLAAGLLGERPVIVHGLRPDTLQGDRALLDITRNMGAEVEVGPGVELVRRVIARPSALRGVDVDMSACPDLVPTVAVLAAAAVGETRIRGVAHLRIKECDRIAAPARELMKAGVSVEERDDGLLIHGRGPDFRLDGRVLELSVWNDHRMAMSLALLECRGADVRLDHPEVVNKSFPAFWETWAALRGGRGRVAEYRSAEV